MVARIKRTALLATCVLSLQLVAIDALAANQPGILVKRQSPPSAESSFNWSSIEPSTQLQWTSCSDKFECARFEVPLDYADSTAGKGAIALMRSPSPLARNDSRYQGPILINPGGPGGSGVEIIEAVADTLRTLLGDAFDFVGFDPRGVGATTPFFTPFVSEAEAGLYWVGRTQSLNHSADAFGTAFANAKNFGAVSAARTGQPAQYVGTPALARDMLSIVKAHGFDKLQYIGVSYGTALGATFAAMFPHNVGKLVLDGVLDPIDYYKGGWLENLVDADAVLELLYESCVTAGPTGCPMYESSAAKISRRVQTLLNNVRLNPVPFFTVGQGSSPDTYGVVDYSIVKTTIFSTVYQPSSLGPELFTALADLERGNATAIWNLSGVGAFQDFIIQPPACPSPLLQDIPQGSVPGVAIACGDGEQVTDSLDTLRTKYAKAAKTSVFAEVFTMHMSCSGWTIRAKERFNASFATNTSFPILFMSNEKDPVTPLRNAKLMSGLFKNSVLLTQNSSGHTTILNPSTCALFAMRDYFQQGILPNASTVCQPDNGPSPFQFVPRASQLRDAFLEPLKRLSVRRLFNLN